MGPGVRFRLLFPKRIGFLGFSGRFGHIRNDGVTCSSHVSAPALPKGNPEHTADWPFKGQRLWIVFLSFESAENNILHFRPFEQPRFLGKSH
jgi:hypothetical protein